MTEFAGALRERVAIERRLEGRDAWARVSGGYGYDGAAWAAVTPLVPGDLAVAESVSALPRWRITMRKREGITPATRLVWRGKFLKVRGVESDPREPAQMLLICEEQR